MRLSVDISKEEHMYLKMCCAKLNISIKDFCAEAVISKIGSCEDKWFLEENEQELENLKKSDDWLSVEELEKELGLNEMEDSPSNIEGHAKTPSSRRQKTYAQAKAY